MSFPAGPFEDRFWPKVFKTPFCWYWTGCKIPKGYGRIGGVPPRKGLYAHRASYEMHKGPIPKGLMVLHSCDNPSCVNPEHLFLGTAADNTADMIKKDREKRGERNANAKLKNGDVIEMRLLYAVGARIRDLAERYGVGRPQVHRIVNNTRWKKVKQIHG